MPSFVFVEVDPEDIGSIRTRFPDARVLSGIPDTEALVKECADAEVLSCFIYTALSREVLDRLPRLRLICTRSVGINHIDLVACVEKGITVCNVPDYGSYVIAEHVFALILSTLRHISEADARVASGTFDYHGLRGMTLRGKTMGIVGTGKIGREVARIAHGFGMHILATDQCRSLEIVRDFGVSYVSLPDLFGQSDIVTLHVPSTPDTRHLLNAAAFDSMKEGVVLVNTARGDLVDSKALLLALKSEKIKYALLDVLEHEKNFEEHKELIAHPNVVVTPHIAFYAEDSMRTMYDDTFRSIDEWKAGGIPKHVVHPVTVVCDMEGVRR